MKKERKKFNSNKDLLLSVIVISIGIFLIAFSIFSAPINDYDEIWNFSFASNVANGLIPYKDFNIISTPLSPIINSAFLSIFGNELIVMRVLAIILQVILLFLIYKTMKNLDVDNFIKYFGTVAFLIVSLKYMRIDYNYFAIVILLLILNIEIINYKKNDKSLLKYNLKYDFIVGILAGVLFTVKQNIGGIACVCLSIYKVLEIRKVTKKEDLKTFAKIFMIRAIGIMIPIIIFIIYLCVNNAFFDFLNYAVYGIGTFVNKKKYGTLLKEEFLYKFLAIVMPSMFLVSTYFYLKKKEKISLILIVFGLINFIVVYPIADKIHFIIGSIVLYIAFCYYVDKLLKASILKNTSQKAKKILAQCTLFGLAATLILITNIKIIESLIIKRNLDIVYSNLEHFKYIPIMKRQKEYNENMLKFMKENDNQVLIIDAISATYMVPANIYNKDFDLCLKGNIGADGSTRLIEELKNTNKKVLIVHDDVVNWQMQVEIIDFIKNNFEKTDTINNFDVYINRKE